MVAAYRSTGRAGQILRFTWHFIQMFIAMGLGMAVLAIIVGLLGYQDLRERFPEGYAVLMTVAMVLPMAVWMRFGMGHGWARTTEMSAAMVVPIAILVVACSVGILPHTAALSRSMALMYVAMLGVMLYRWRDYSQHHHGYGMHTAGVAR